MDPTFLITAFTTLFVVIDPIGLTPLFVTLTQGMDQRTRRAIALRACLIAFAVLGGSAALAGVLAEELGLGAWRLGHVDGRVRGEEIAQPGGA